MKRTVLFIGLLMFVMAGCSKETTDIKKPAPEGEVDPVRSTIVADPESGVVADGIDEVVLTISAKDRAGTAATNRSILVTSSLEQDVVTLSSDITDANGNASARISSVVAGRRIITVKVGQVPLGDSGRIMVDFVPGAAARLEFVAPPGDGQAGRALRPAVRVEVQDLHGNRILDANTDVTLALSDGSLSRTRAAEAGVASFDDVVIDTPNRASEGGYRLIATASGLETATSEEFRITTGVPSRLRFQTQPSSVAAGESLNFKVEVLDGAGNAVQDFSGPTPSIQARLLSNPTAAKLDGTVSVLATNGVATFSALSIGKSASGYTLVVSAPGFEGAESVPFAVTGSDPVGGSSRMTAGSALVVADGVSTSKLSIRVVDGKGNELPNAPVVLSTESEGVTFAPGNTLRTDAIGRAEAWVSSTVAGLATIKADVGGGALELTASVRFVAGAAGGTSTVVALDYDDLDLQTHPTADGVEEIEFLVTVIDANQNPVLGETVAISATGGANFWSETSSESNAMGLVTFKLRSDKAETKTIKAVVQGTTLPPVTVTFKPGAPDRGQSQLATGTPQTGIVGKPLGTAFGLRVRDKKGNLVPGADVTFAVATGGGQLIVGETGTPVPGPVTVAAGDNGIASVLLVLGTGAGAQTVSATAWSGQQGSPTPVTFTATANADTPTTIRFGQGPGVLTEGVTTTGTNVASGTAAVAAAQRLSVKVTDQHNNPVSGFQITFAVESAPDSFAALTTTAITTNATGDATVSSMTLSRKVGQNVFTAVRTTGTPALNGPSRYYVNVTPGNPAKIVIPTGTNVCVPSGNNQSGTVGTALTTTGAPLRLQVQVTDTNDNPIENQAVNFTPNTVADGGSFTSSMTNGNGCASTTYTLATTAGAKKAKAAVTGITSTAVFDATAVAGPVTDIAYDAGNNQTGTAGGPKLSNPISVILKDQYGNPVGGQPVTFAVVTGGGSLVSTGLSSTTAGANFGKATADWTLGTVAAPPSQDKNNSATATFGTLTPPVTFYATGRAGGVATLEPVSGNNQAAIVGTQLGAPLVIRAVDANSNPVPGATITYTVTGNGTVTPNVNPFRTDDNGLASATFRLGRVAGGTTNSVRFASGTPFVVFNAIANPGTATQFTMVSGNFQEAEAGTDLPLPVVLKVMDADNNAIEGRLVSFRIDAGGGTAGAASVATGPDGTASTGWTLGTTVGWGHVLVASTTGLPERAFVARATPPAGMDGALMAVAGDGEVAGAGSEFGSAMVVRLVDENGDAVAGKLVEFAADGPVTLTDGQAITDAEGLAWVFASADQAAADGPVTVTASVKDFNALPTELALEIAEPASDSCTAYGASFASFGASAVKLQKAAVYSAGTLGAHEVQVKVAPAVKGKPELGAVNAGVVMRCGAGTEQVAELRPTGLFVDGQEAKPGTFGNLSVLHVANAWTLDCNGELVVSVDDAVGGAFHSMVVQHAADGAFSGGVCGSATAAPAKASLFSVR
ncbi:Ig-like domain-containing protein [Vulgatibacter incomptus]|uniref:Fibronectin type III domain protein n=1 Tax=Vulgatibacter incomptus TaxID=1391653 RepID=A0A0K1PID6_9BACT|nr:Ig-like domain-containing protein [Vulgatibacter incomptus]AKU93303.1 Fibronectin type III domain protein [Vulgatibacter incomptus]